MWSTRVSQTLDVRGPGVTCWSLCRDVFLHVGETHYSAVFIFFAFILFSSSFLSSFCYCGHICSLFHPQLPTHPPTHTHTHSQTYTHAHIYIKVHKHYLTSTASHMFIRYCKLTQLISKRNECFCECTCLLLTLVPVADTKYSVRVYYQL